MYDNERRKALRQRVEGTTTAYVYYQGKRLHKGKVMNISGRDVLLKTPSLAVPNGSVVQLLFTIDTGNVVKTHRKSALITRVSDSDTTFACSFITRKQK
jgi:hypothetical protein